MTDDLSSTLDKIESALRGLDRHVLLGSLNAGVPVERVRSSLHAVGLPSTGELESLYGWRNGTSTAAASAVDDIHLFPGFYLLSLEDAVASYRAIAPDDRWRPSACLERASSSTWSWMPTSGCIWRRGSGRC